MHKVETKNGQVTGISLKSGCAWLGIPYAVPPLGALRFKPAQPAPDRSVLRAAAFGPIAMQERKKANMSEDCLTLNIWSPAADAEKRPVLFFIHGGSFCNGSGSEADLNGESLSAWGDAVVVTFNYRLGALGFLDFSFLGDEFHPNCGLTDIVQALLWTHRNIAAFGGDPDRITVFGQSAGAVAASLLPVMPAARPYVSRVIMMSGDPTLPQTTAQCQNTARRFLSFMRIRDKDSLLSMPAAQLIARQREFSRSCGLGAGTFMPQIDGELVPEYPIPAVLKGAAGGIPILIGTTREEMSFLFKKPFAGMLDIRDVLEDLAQIEAPEIRADLSEAYRRFGRRGQIWMLSDIVFRVGSAWYAEAYSRFADTWMYRFDYEAAAMRVSGLHAFHSCDIPFVFGNFRKGLAPWMFAFSPYRGAIRKISDEIRGDFMTFARTGQLGWEKCRGPHTPGKTLRARAGRGGDDRAGGKKRVFPHRIPQAQLCRRSRGPLGAAVKTPVIHKTEKTQRAALRSYRKVRRHAVNAFRTCGR